MIIKLIGLLEIVLGVIFLLNTDNFRRFISFFSEGKKPYLGGFLKILIGSIFLFTATQCRVVWIMVTLGVLALAGGILILTRETQKAKSLIAIWKDKPVSVLRLYAVLALLVGALIIYSA